jgi:hypothetical protein
VVRNWSGDASDEEPEISLQPQIQHTAQAPAMDAILEEEE